MEKSCQPRFLALAIIVQGPGARGLQPSIGKRSKVCGQQFSNPSLCESIIVAPLLRSLAPCWENLVDIPEMTSCLIGKLCAEILLLKERHLGDGGFGCSTWPTQSMLSRCESILDRYLSIPSTPNTHPTPYGASSLSYLNLFVIGTICLKVKVL